MFSSIDLAFVKSSWERCGLPEDFSDVQPDYPEFMRFANEILQRAYDSESRSIIVHLVNGDSVEFPHTYRYEVDHGVLHIIGGLIGQSHPVASYGIGTWFECDNHSHTAFSPMIPADPKSWDFLTHTWTAITRAGHTDPFFEFARQLVESREQAFLKANF